MFLRHVCTLSLFILSLCLSVQLRHKQIFFHASTSSSNWKSHNFFYKFNKITEDETDGTRGVHREEEK
jgi:hypothetical protein